MGILRLLITLFFIILIICMAGVYPSVALIINTALILSFFAIKEEF